MTRGTGWTFENFAGFAGRLVVSQGLVPEGARRTWPGAPGATSTQHWRDFGTLMVQHGRGDSVVRLGWEFNGDFMAWRGPTRQTWIGCYRRAADGIRATNPAVDPRLDDQRPRHPGRRLRRGQHQLLPGRRVRRHHRHRQLRPLPRGRRPRPAFDRIGRRTGGPDLAVRVRHAARQAVLGRRVGRGARTPTAAATARSSSRWMHDWFAAHAADLAYEAYFSTARTAGCSRACSAPTPDASANPGQRRRIPTTVRRS